MIVTRLPTLASMGVQERSAAKRVPLLSAPHRPGSHVLRVSALRPKTTSTRRRNKRCATNMSPKVTASKEGTVNGLMEDPRSKTSRKKEEPRLERK